MPEARLQLTGPDGKEIQEEKGANTPGVINGDGAHFFSLQGPGVFLVKVRADLNVVAHGEGANERSFDGRVDVSVE